MKKLPNQCDHQHEEIMFIFNSLELMGKKGPYRYLKIATKSHALKDIIAKTDCVDEWIYKLGPGLWQEKYNEVIDPGCLDGIWAENLNASLIPYDGPTSLTDEEQAIIGAFMKDSMVDLTMEMLYFMIEGLGWRPGMAAESKKLPPRQEMVEFLEYYHFHRGEYGALENVLQLVSADKEGNSVFHWRDLFNLERSLIYEMEAKQNEGSSVDEITP
jgi:hypothetical protein